MAHRLIRPQSALFALLLTALCACAAARADFAANVTIPVHVRAGPAVEYPSVVLLPAGALVRVFGCEQDYGWCDVQAGPERGWVAAEYLQMAGNSGPVVIGTGGVSLGIPIVSFNFNTYWGNYYRGRPWFARQPYYARYWRRYPHGVPPPPPRPPHMRPPPRPRPPPAIRPPPGRPRPPHAAPVLPPGTGRPPGGRPPQDRPRPDNNRPANPPAGPGN